jgi:DNA-binding MarR family transcriptional regulator
MPAKPPDFYDLTFLVRRCFQRLRRVGDRLHRDLGITASMRAVLEDLDGHGARTVPRMAEAKDVSRQHIQQIVDALRDRGLVEAKDNPGHRRSPHIVLTPAGRQAFAALRERERALIAELAGAMTEADVAGGRTALQRLLDILEPHSKGDDNDDSD